MQGAGRKASNAIILGIEKGEILTQNLIRLIALGALGTHVPARDGPNGVEHVNGVVRYALDQQAKPLLAFAQRFVRRATFGQIARDLCEAQQSPIGITDGVDHDIGPEMGAVLAHAPAFGFKSPFLLCRRQRGSGYPCGLILGCVEAGKMLADNLVGLIAFEAARAGIPAGNPAIGIQHEDRIIRHALNQ